MNPNSLANLLWIVLTVVVLIVVVRAMTSLLVAEFRHDVFAIRRQLFLLAAKGKIDPSRPAYSQLRKTLNGLLSRAEEITGFQLIVILIGMHITEQRPESIVRRIRAEIRMVPDPETREELLRLRLEMENAVRRHLRNLLPTSPVMVLLLVFSVALGKAVGMKKRLVSFVEADAFRFGMNEVAAC